MEVDLVWNNLSGSIQFTGRINGGFLKYRKLFNIINIDEMYAKSKIKGVGEENSQTPM